METILKSLQLDQGGQVEVIDRASVTRFLGQLTEQLTQAQEELELLQKRNGPLIAEFNTKNTKLKQNLAQLKSEYTLLDSKTVINVLERRKNDVRTEEAYLDKILNREIHGEFVSILKAELKSLVQSIDPNNNLEQVPASHSGCPRMQSASLFVSGGTEKLCSTIHLCCSEVATKVFSNQPDKYGAFADFCVQIVASFSRKLVTKKAQQLPQFLALLCNDLAYLIAFVFERFSGIKSAASVLYSLRSLRQQLLGDFLTLHRREIRDFIANTANVHELDRSMKRVTLHLNRLANVLRPVLLAADFVNILVVLLQESHEAAWKLIFGFADIGADELEPIEKFLQQVIELPEKLFNDEKLLSVVQASLPLTRKLEGLVQILPLGLVSIINAYHREEFSGKLQASEIAKLIDAIFADSSLKSEFLYELSLE